MHAAHACQLTSRRRNVRAGRKHGSLRIVQPAGKNVGPQHVPHAAHTHPRCCTTQLVLAAQCSEHGLHEGLQVRLECLHMAAPMLACILEVPVQQMAQQM